MIDPQNEVTGELRELVHDQDLYRGIGRDGAIAYEERHLLRVLEPVDDCTIVSEAESQYGKLTVRRPDLEVALATGTQFVEASRQIPAVRTFLTW